MGETHSDESASAKSRKRVDTLGRVLHDVLYQFLAAGQIVDHSDNLTRGKHAGFRIALDKSGLEQHRCVGCMMICISVRSPDRFIARPSLARVDHFMPVMALNFVAFLAAAIKPVA